ncbi:TolC family protein [Anaerotignum lactatifermentans]|uniref:Outer membrane efflux protein n=1 Tax=Anaerotignum lactatifermentans DSM 14214 TaxID=1121323 RepID=A0A1M6NJ12_9FIRM|nr:TolC family protein [Anaerotignum lactatifermentans]SHJ95677.1 Outer membrane efflux protein [[Clostridium] lactatifermentans DSM 14214] [Anaerotignum lactatifermentans DSM 14214]
MKYKLALLLTLTMMMPTATTAFAAETSTETAAESTSEEGTVSTEESGVWQLTYEEALELAEDNSSDLDNVAEKAEYLQDLKEDIWDITDSFSVPTVSYQQWVDDDVYSIYSQIQSISSSMTQNRYTEEITKLTLESTVKSYFTSILSDESSLEVAKKEAEVKKTQYLQGQTKNKMGLISDYDLRTLETDYKTAVDNVETLERTIEEEYRSFNQLLGISDDTEYELVYDIEYTPYEMGQSMTQYIQNKLNTDYTIKQLEQNVDDAEFNKNYMSMSSTNSQSASNKYSYEEAKSTLKTAKEDKELAIQNAYNEVQELENQYETAQRNLETAKSNLELAELNYSLGRNTALDVTKAELDVEEAENTLAQIVYSHDMKVYQLENTELL